MRIAKISNRLIKTQRKGCRRGELRNGWRLWGLAEQEFEWDRRTLMRLLESIHLLSTNDSLIQNVKFLKKLTGSMMRITVLERVGQRAFPQWITSQKLPPFS